MPNTQIQAEAPVYSESQDRIVESIAVIDQMLGKVSSRNVVSADEVADLLLDVRTILSPSATE